MKKVLNEKNLTKAKIIALENDNDHFQNILRQNEALIEDLNNQLESALEENIFVYKSNRHIPVNTDYNINKESIGKEILNIEEKNLESEIKEKEPKRKKAKII